MEGEGFCFVGGGGRAAVLKMVAEVVALLGIVLKNIVFRKSKKTSEDEEERTQC